MAALTFSAGDPLMPLFDSRVSDPFTAKCREYARGDGFVLRGIRAGVIPPSTYETNQNRTRL